MAATLTKAVITTATLKQASIKTNGGGFGKKPGRPKGSRDTKPRKTRSDKGKKRGPYKKKGGGVEA